MGAMRHSFRKIAACGSICVVPIFSQAGTAFKGAWMTFCLIEEQTVTFTALRTERNLQPYWAAPLEHLKKYLENFQAEDDSVLGQIFYSAKEGRTFFKTKFLILYRQTVCNVRSVCHDWAINRNNGVNMKIVQWRRVKKGIREKKCGCLGVFFWQTAIKMLY